jgi:hypothetical protein
MAQQTSVDFLWRWWMDNPFASYEEGVEAYRKAKEMHKAETLRFVKTMPKEKGITQEGEAYVQYDAEAHYNNTYNK